MIIDAYFTPLFPETEKQFQNSAVIMIDVLRASTSICAALYNGAKEVIPCDSLEKAVSIYNNLSRESRFIGGERDLAKPAGFDAGNSPFEYTSEAVKGKTVIISTSNGTKTFNKARQATVRLIGSFSNYSAILEHLEEEYLLNNELNIEKIVVLCSGTNGRFSYEDSLCAGIFINEIAVSTPKAELSDTAYAAKALYELHSDNLEDFLFTRDHSKKLIEANHKKDVELCLKYNSYPVVPVYEGNSIKRVNI